LGAWHVIVSPVLSYLPRAASTGLNNRHHRTLKTYIDPVTDITLVIGGIVGIVGGIRVYSKWNSGDQDINKELMGWGGSCLFLVLSSLDHQSLLSVCKMAARYSQFIRGSKGPLLYKGFQAASISTGAWVPCLAGLVLGFRHHGDWSICGWGLVVLVGCIVGGLVFI
jgi:hypothetical protein